MAVRYKYQFCRKCKQKLPSSDFSNPNKKDIDTCKLCKEISKLRARTLTYKIDIVDFLDMYETQDGKCYTCEKPCSYNEIHIDHCHSKGNVRGLLCRNCNLALGMVKDRKEILLKMIEYLGG